MRTNTLVTLGASAVFGVMAILLARGWIEGAVEDEFRQDPVSNALLSQLPQQTGTPTVPVVVANMDLAFGDQLTPDVFRVVDMPEDAVPLEALEDLSSIFKRDYDPLTDGALVALDDIRMNEIILPHRISGLNGRGSLSAQIRPGYRAVSVLQAVRVLGIDQSHNRQQDQAEVARTVTLEVSHMDAQALAVAQESGTLSLVLRAVGEALPSTTQSLDTRQLDRRANSNSAAKKPRSPVKVTTKKAAPAVAQIKVIRGEDTQSVSVKREALPRSSNTELAGG